MKVIMKTNLHFKIVAIGLTIFLFAGNNLTAQENWVKYENNPVLSAAPWSSNARSPVVLFEDNEFKMWFVGEVVNGNAIGYAESADGINWNPDDNPVIPTGVQGNWDASRQPGSVIRVGDTLKMWYSGSSDDFNFNISIGYAYSLDDINWYLESDPVLEHGETGTWDGNAVFKPVVYFDGSVYHMWYHGFEGFTYDAPSLEGYATSTDGINWVKYKNNPVLLLGEDGSFYDTWIIGSCVLFVEEEFQMWFTGWDGFSTNPLRYMRIGHATSADGIEWTVQNNDLPVLDVGETGEWDDELVRYSSVLIHDGQFKMWYDGRGEGTSIGYATDGWVGLRETIDPLQIQMTISPNPFSSSTTIEYKASNTETVRIVFYNQLGKEVDVIETYQKKGINKVMWTPEQFANGMYYFTLEAGRHMALGKMVLMK